MTGRVSGILDLVAVFRFSAGDDPISNPAKWAAEKEVIMSSVNTKPRRRRLKSWFVRQVSYLFRNPRLLKGAFTVGIFVYRVYRALKSLTETSDG